MELREYFENLKGNGVLATADDQGHVDVAIYSKPHIMDDETIVFIMPDRLTHHNLQSNNHAAYLFKEEGPGYKGIRFFLTKLLHHLVPQRRVANFLLILSRHLFEFLRRQRSSF